VSSSISAPEGIINPPIDELLEATDSKYSLVIYAAKRARQINAYYSQLGEGLLEYVGPLVDTHVHEKPLSIALREINAWCVVESYVAESGERRWTSRRSFWGSAVASPPTRPVSCCAG
jgi:DNA-directed RNA polymerase subunit omega